MLQSVKNLFFYTTGIGWIVQWMSVLVCYAPRYPAIMKKKPRRIFKYFHYFTQLCVFYELFWQTYLDEPLEVANHFQQLINLYYPLLCDAHESQRDEK